MRSTQPELYSAVEAAVCDARRAGLDHPVMSFCDVSDDEDDRQQQAIKALSDRRVRDFQRAAGLSARQVEHMRRPGTALYHQIGNFETQNKDAQRCLFNFQLFGEKTILVDDQITAGLALKPVRRAAENLRLPARSCMFVYPAIEAINALRRANGAVTGLARKAPDVDYDSPVCVFLSLCDPDAIYSNHPYLELVAIHADGSSMRFMNLRALYLHPGWTLEQVLRFDDAEDSDDAPHDPYAHRHENSTVFDDRLAFHRLVLNTCFAISDHPDSVRPGIADPKASGCSQLAYSIVAGH